MEGISIIIPVFNKIDTTLHCVRSIAERNKGTAYEMVVVDNGSTDRTEEVFSKDIGAGAALNSPRELPERITYIRHPVNRGVSKALNAGARAARGDIFCFMHNDVFVQEDNWTALIETFLKDHEEAGVVGFYGAKTIRRDGSFRGKSIIHSKKGSPSINRPYEAVAVVDGLLLAVRRDVFERIGGFSDEFIVHFYDKDISLKSRAGRFVNYVLNVPFDHLCAATRTDIPDDDRIRDEAKEQFLKKWADTLPVDVTTWRDRMGYIIRGKRAD